MLDPIGVKEYEGGWGVRGGDGVRVNGRKVGRGEGARAEVKAFTTGKGGGGGGDE